MELCLNISSAGGEEAPVGTGLGAKGSHREPFTLSSAVTGMSLRTARVPQRIGRGLWQRPHVSELDLLLEPLPSSLEQLLNRSRLAPRPSLA